MAIASDIFSPNLTKEGWTGIIGAITSKHASDKLQKDYTQSWQASKCLQASLDKAYRYFFQGEVLLETIAIAIALSPSDSDRKPPPHPVPH